MLRPQFISAAHAATRGRLPNGPRLINDVVVFGIYSTNDKRDFAVRLFPKTWKPGDEATSMYGKHSPYLEEVSTSGRRVKVFRSLDAVHSFLTVPADEKTWVINDYKVVWCCDQSDFMYTELRAKKVAIGSTWTGSGYVRALGMYDEPLVEAT